MKSILLKSILFFLPIIAVSSVVELNLRKHNTFRAKAQYLQKEKDNINILIFGSSQNTYAIDPQYLSKPTINLANGQQALKFDHLLFDRYFDELKNLELVIFELSYHTLENTNGPDHIKNHLYEIFFDIDIPGKTSKEHFMFFSNPKEYIKKFNSNLRLIPDITEQGFIQNLNQLGGSRFHNLSYDSLQIIESSKGYMFERHSAEDTAVYNSNALLLDSMIQKCLDNGIKVVLLSPPKFYLYNDSYVTAKLERREQYLQKTLQKDVEFWNYETTYERETELFANEDHLQPVGSKEFTKTLDERIVRYLE